MNSSNKKRLLELINILTRNSSENNPLSLNEIMQLLDTRGISNINRKTLYDDFKVLEECGYNLEKAGNYYYLSENPFSMSEIKIILDSLHSLRNIDYSFLKKLDDKLYAFLSYDEEKQLRKLEYTNRHKDDKFILRLEDVLYAIRNNETVILKDRKNRQSVIGPCFLYRDNNYYYLYYHYENSEKLYKTRFDNISSISLTGNRDLVSIDRNTILDYINSGTNVYNKGKVETIRFEIINPSDALNNRLMDDFGTYVPSRNGFTIKSSVNEALFSKLTAYGDDIKISDRDIADQYLSFLNKIITRNK